jgi:hypothetical protein
MKKKSVGGVLHVGDSQSPFVAKATSGQAGDDNVYNLPGPSTLSFQPFLHHTMKDDKKDLDVIESGRVQTGTMKPPMRLPKD